jgi:hypothetical protein
LGHACLTGREEVDLEKKAPYFMYFEESSFLMFYCYCMGFDLKAFRERLIYRDAFPSTVFQEKYAKCNFIPVIIFSWSAPPMAMPLDDSW